MAREMPTPDQMLEELVDRVGANIDRNAPIAFDNSLRELVRYHRFLLELSSTSTASGNPASYAEVPGIEWSAPHQRWIYQYGRLFQKAAERIPDDRHFMRSLIQVPLGLLSQWDETRLPGNVVRAIVSLGTTAIFRIEAWVTKRTTVEVQNDEPAMPKVGLSGSDQKALLAVMPDVVGAWEQLVQFAPYLYGWNDRQAEGSEDRWRRYCECWNLTWSHLTDTAQCLAVAVWNDDDTSSGLFREALARWASGLPSFLFEQPSFLRRRWVYSSLLNLDWALVEPKVRLLAVDNAPPLNADQVFSALISKVFDDVILITSAVLVSWGAKEKLSSDLGTKTARSLLIRQGDEDSAPLQFGAGELSLSSLLLAIFRIESGFEDVGGATYLRDINNFVEKLDNMTERRVVPGRVFTPSTINSFYDLRRYLIPILLCSVPATHDPATVEHFRSLARETQLLPGGDRALRNMLRVFEDIRSTLEKPNQELFKPVEVLAPGCNLQEATAALNRTIVAIEEAIRDERQSRLRNSVVGPDVLDALRQEMQNEIFREPIAVPYFRKIRVERGARDSSVSRVEISFKIEKDQLVTPAMSDVAIESVGNWLALGLRQNLHWQVFRQFALRPRVKIASASGLLDPEFWRDLSGAVTNVGSKPILIVSGNSERRALTEALYSSTRRPTDIVITSTRTSDVSGSYLATIEGVEVYADNLVDGKGWLFSSDALNRVQCFPLGMDDRFVDLAYHPVTDASGILAASYRIHADWDTRLVYEVEFKRPH
jgi:hypothetical protein